MADAPAMIFNPVFSLWPRAVVQRDVREAPRSSSVIRSAPMSGFSVETEVGSPGTTATSLDSAGSILSIGSAGSVLSIGSAGSILSIGSAGSVLSIGSAGSVLSIGSIGSVASIGSAFSIGAVGGWLERRGRVVEVAATAVTLAALITAARR